VSCVDCGVACMFVTKNPIRTLQ